jgi:hypothetical protein
MNLLQDIITYVRRIIKSPSNAVITDSLIIDYINRFWIMDIDARVQLFDFKTKYQFQTQPGVDKYNMPLYSMQTQPGSQAISMYPVYQGFTETCYINGIQIPFQTQKNQFFNIWPNIVQNLGQIGTANGTVGPYILQIPIIGPPAPPNPPLNSLARGHIDIAGIIALSQGLGDYVDPPVVDTVTAQSSIPAVPVTSVDAALFITTAGSDGSNVIVSDSGQFLEGAVNYGLLMTPGAAPFGNLPLPGGYSTTSNTINYLTGQITVEFPVIIPAGNNIYAQCFYYQTGLPRAILFYNNTIILRTVPDSQYLVEIDAYLSPAAFLNSSAGIPFGYMAEYIARGAARKILSDTGDIEQFQFYEPLFKEQELLVWKRSQRIWTSSRTESIYSQGFGQGAGFNNNYGGGVSL